MDQRTPEKRIRMQHPHQDPEGVQVEEGETLPLIEDLLRGNRQVRASQMLGCCVLF